MTKKAQKSLAFILMVSLVLTILLAGCGTNSSNQAANDQKTYKLRFTSVMAENAAQSKGIIAWAKELEKRTNGQVKVEQMTWNGALLKPDNLLEGIRDRVVDVAYISSLYHPTKTPLSNALQPVFIDDMAGSASVEMELYNTVPEIKEEWLKWNVVPVAWFAGADQVLFTNFEFDSLEDMKGKKLRAIGAVMPLAVKSWGAIPINIASADTYSAMEKGTVDGIAGFPAYAIISNKVGEVSKQITDFRYGGQAMWFGIGFNKDAYNELPDNVKKVIADIAAIPAEVATKADQEDAMAGFKQAKQLGVKFVQLSPEEAAKWQQAINPQAVWEQNLKAAEAAGYKNVRQIMDKAVQMMKDYDAKNPHKTLVEQFLEQEKAGK